MKTRSLPFSAKLRQYRYLAKQIDRALKDGSFRLLSKARQQKLLRKLRQRLRRIASLVSERKMKHALAGIAMLVGVGLANPADAQTFGPRIDSPFGLPTTEDVVFGTFADLDGDGDIDYISQDYNYGSYDKVTKFYENTGTANSPVFSIDNFIDEPFGITTPGYVTVPVFADIDTDGDLDLFIGKYDGGGIFFLENTGTADAPAFAAAVENPFGFSGGYQFDVPTFVDIDGDGDLDVFSTEYYGGIRYFENVGTPEAPSFGPVSSDFFGLLPPPVLSYATFPVFSDLDDDGDYDLFYSTFYYGETKLFFAENEGNASVAAFSSSVEDPFGLSASGLLFAAPSFADIDDDGDDDLFMNANEYYGGGFLAFHENLQFDDNVAPTSTDAEITIEEDEGYIFSADDFPFIDGDLSDVLAAVQVTELPTEGELTLNLVPVTQDQEIAAADLQNLVYTPAQDGFGSPYDNFQFKVSDGEFVSSESFTMSVNVTPVNDFPSAADSEVSTYVDETYAFTADDFQFTDVDGDDFGMLQVTQAVDKGTFQLDGTDIPDGQLIPANLIDQMTYTPLPGEEGVPYTTFQFKVSDGQVFAPTTYTMTVNVPGVNATAEAELDAEVQLSPNPAPDMVRVKVLTDSPLDDLQYAVFDAAGKRLATAKFAQQALQMTEEIDVSDYAAGLYFVKIFAEGKAKTVKFIKE